MFQLTPKFIRDAVADSDLIFRRGEKLYQNGAYCRRFADPAAGRFEYSVDGSYGDYTIHIEIADKRISARCDCPYPNTGCKHTVAALLDISRSYGETAPPQCPPCRSAGAPAAPFAPTAIDGEDLLTPPEIRAQALEDRKKRARSEKFTVTPGDTFKGEHLLTTPRGRQYLVTFHDPENGRGHCSCPDYATSRLNTCKHMIFLQNYLKSQPKFKERVKKENFPFVDIYWDAEAGKPRVFRGDPESISPEMRAALAQCFDADGLFTGPDLSALMPLLALRDSYKGIKIQAGVLKKLDAFWMERQLADLARTDTVDVSAIQARLYPYQQEGIAFCAFRRAALIGDEMGLGKTLQAIGAALVKRRIFGFTKVLVVTLASLKEQWKREIERFTSERAVIISGSAANRRHTYESSDAFFKITNYEALLRDITPIARFKPDLIILDEAQRIKNLNTKTADAVKRVPRKHALVLTGTPLENRLEDVYSVVQFLDPDLLSPLWAFAADHFMLSRSKKGKILGYRNLDALHRRLSPLVIRRKKAEVLADLPDAIVNNYYIDLTDRQYKIHGGYAQLLGPLINKKFLTPMDLRRIQELLLKMRQVCDSTFLIDRQSHISPKLSELASIIDDLVVQSGRKVVIFSEWTTMTYLIARQLSEAGVAFVELSGKVPVTKRQPLIDEFFRNPDCKVFLSTDAGGTGLNLQAADCVINFELPWSPARLNQRIGRVNRIGQKSRCVNVINLIAKHSIEEKIYAGLQLKTDLFKGVFDGGLDSVAFSNERRTELLNRLREMMNEEPAAPRPDLLPGEEIPEDTPHYLNPRVLSEAEAAVPYDAEENDAADDGIEPHEIMEETDLIGAMASGQLPDGPENAKEKGLETPSPREKSDSAPSPFAGQSPEKIETVLNSGMQFIAGLFEMATGKKMEAPAEETPMIRIDRDTGEVTMKFRLPGF